MFAIDVPRGSTEVRVHVGTLSSEGADVDVYLFSCVEDAALKAKLGATYPVFTQGKCTFRTAANTSSGATASTAFPSTPEVDVPSIPPGRWVAVVDAYRLPMRPVHLTYSDIVVNRVYGEMRIYPHATYVRSGERWSQVYRIVRGMPVPPARTLVVFPGMTASEAGTIYTNITGATDIRKSTFSAAAYTYHNVLLDMFTMHG
jgi:hypothetical protein